LGYRPALDGLRALAVLAVIGLHIGVIPGGYIGVDVFFVLSGFLITSLLLTEHATTGSISLRDFYRRRALRLAPALVAYLMVGSLATIAGGTTAQRHDLPLVALSVATYWTNWGEALGAWNTSAVFQHCWSLAIEEQFYLVWPVVLVWLSARRVDVRRLAIMLAGGALLVAGWRAVLSFGSSQDRVYFGTDTRLDPILIGCTIAALAHGGILGRARRFGAAAVVVGGAVLAGVLAWGHADDDVMIRIGLSVVALSAALIVVGLILCPDQPIARILSTRPFVAVGRISYGLYLWHILAVRMFNGQEFTALTQLAVVALSFALALGSYVIIERPFLAMKGRLRETPISPEMAASTS